MRQIWEWLKRIIEIGILEFLRSLGWKLFAALFLGVVAVLGLIVVLTLILVAILF